MNRISKGLSPIPGQQVSNQNAGSSVISPILPKVHYHENVVGSKHAFPKMRTLSPDPAHSKLLLNPKEKDFRIESSQNSAFKPVLKKPKFKTKFL